MDIFKILAFSLVSLMLILVLEKTNKEASVLLMLIASVIVFLSIFSGIKSVISVLEKLAESAGINKSYLVILLKVTGIAYLVEIVKNVCVDAGNSALGSKVELAGKISIATLTIPLVSNVISLVGNIV